MVKQMRKTKNSEIKIGNTFMIYLSNRKMGGTGVS